MNSGRSARRLRFLIGFRVCAAWALQLFLPGSSRQRTISVRLEQALAPLCMLLQQHRDVGTGVFDLGHYVCLAFSTESVFSERPIPGQP